MHQNGSGAPQPDPDSTGPPNRQYRSREQLWPVLSDPHYVLPIQGSLSGQRPIIRPARFRTGHSGRSTCTDPCSTSQRNRQADPRSSNSYVLSNSSSTEEITIDTFHNDTEYNSAEVTNDVVTDGAINVNNNPLIITQVNKVANEVEDYVATVVAKVSAESNEVEMSLICKCHPCGNFCDLKEYQTTHLIQCVPSVVDSIKVNCICGRYFRVDKNFLVSNELCRHTNLNNNRTVQEDADVNATIETFNGLSINDIEYGSQFFDNTAMNSNINEETGNLAIDMNLSSESDDPPTEIVVHNRESEVNGDAEITTTPTNVCIERIVETVDNTVQGSSTITSELNEDEPENQNVLINDELEEIIDGHNGDESSEAEDTYLKSPEGSEDEATYLSNSDEDPEDGELVDGCQDEGSNNDEELHHNAEEYVLPNNGSSELTEQYYRNVYNSVVVSLKEKFRNQVDSMTPQDDDIDDDDDYNDHGNERRNNNTILNVSQNNETEHNQSSDATDLNVTFEYNYAMIRQDNESVDDNFDNENERPDNDNADECDEANDLASANNGSSQLTEYNNTNGNLSIEETPKPDDTVAHRNDGFDNHKIDDENEEQDDEIQMAYFSEMCMMYKFDFLKLRWISKGPGKLLILHNPDNNSWLLQFRRLVSPGDFRISRIIPIHPGLRLQQMKYNDRAWEWTYHYLTPDGRGEFENLGVRFGREDLAAAFRGKFEAVKMLVNATNRFAMRYRLATSCPTWPPTREVFTPSDVTSTYGAVSPTFHSSSPSPSLYNLPPSDGAGTPTDSAITPNDAAITPNNAPIALPVGVITPNDRVVTPIDGAITPNDRVVTPIDAAITPNDGVVTPMNGAITPNDRVVTPIDGATPPADAMLPTIGVTEHVAVQTDPNDDTLARLPGGQFDSKPSTSKSSQTLRTVSNSEKIENELKEIKNKQNETLAAVKTMSSLMERYGEKSQGNNVMVTGNAQDRENPEADEDKAQENKNEGNCEAPNDTKENILSAVSNGETSGFADSLKPRDVISSEFQNNNESSLNDARREFRTKKEPFKESSKGKENKNKYSSKKKGTRTNVPINTQPSDQLNEPLADNSNLTSPADKEMDSDDSNSPKNNVAKMSMSSINKELGTNNLNKDKPKAVDTNGTQNTPNGAVNESNAKPNSNTSVIPSRPDILTTNTVKPNKNNVTCIENDNKINTEQQLLLPTAETTNETKNNSEEKGTESKAAAKIIDPKVEKLALITAITNNKENQTKENETNKDQEATNASVKPETSSSDATKEKDLELAKNEEDNRHEENTKNTGEENVDTKETSTVKKIEEKPLNESNANVLNRRPHHITIRIMTICCRIIFCMFGLGIVTLVTILLIYFFEDIMFSFVCLE